MQPNANRDYAQPVKSHSPSQKLSKAYSSLYNVLVKDYTACFLEHSSQGEGGGHLETVRNSPWKHMENHKGTINLSNPIRNGLYLLQMLQTCPN